MDSKLFIWTNKMQKYCPQNLIHLGYVKLNGFHDNLYFNSKYRMFLQEIIISHQQLILENLSSYQTNQ